jgi:hypothetical protein
MPEFGVGAQIGPNLQKMIDQAHLPSWLSDRFHDEGAALQQASFAATMYVKGYGRDPRFGLPTDQTSLNILLNPSDPFWSSTQQHGADRDYGVSHAPKLSTTTHWTLGPFESIAKIPILGPVFKAAVAPITSVAHLAEGQPIGQAMKDNFASQVGAIKAVGPYAVTVISFVLPGIGTGVAAALSAGAALAEGKPIDAALEDAIKGAIPGGALAASGFELAKRVASGENVGKAALESARTALPPEAQKAFDVGIAVVTGKQLQQALTAGITSLAPDAIKQVFDVGAKAIQSTPGLAAIVQSLPSDVAKQGAQLASGALAHAGINETQIRAMRSKLTGDTLKGFDAGLQGQIKHFPWIESIAGMPPGATSTPVVETTEQQELSQLAQLAPDQQKQLVNLAALSKLTPDQQAQLVAYAQAQKQPTAAPKPPEPAKPQAVPKPPEPTRAAPAAPAGPSVTPAAGPPAYPPYPKATGTVHGLGKPSYGGYPGGGGALGEPAPSCRVWGAPVEFDPAMRAAARAALASSKGRPAVSRAPGGVLYMFSLENGVLQARPCVSGE